jgi:hypothetical protein
LYWIFQDIAINEAMADWTCHQVSATLKQIFWTDKQFCGSPLPLFKDKNIAEKSIIATPIYLYFISYNLMLCYLVAFVSLFIQMQDRELLSPFSIISL